MIFITTMLVGKYKWSYSVWNSSPNLTFFFLLNTYTAVCEYSCLATNTTFSHSGDEWNLKLNLPTFRNYACFVGKTRVTASPSEPDEVVAWDREKQVKVPEVSKDSQGDLTNICCFHYDRNRENKLQSSIML